MNDLFPPIEPYSVKHVQMDELHSLYVEQCGNPQGIPVVFLHGGPGAGCEPYHRCFFDPQRYRIILFDQRGSGRSTPHAELRNNTTWDLLADMEIIRTRLGVERWLLFGGSWGSTLALVYAQSHPERVLGMVLRGIFLCRDEEIRWFYQEGASWAFPDYWQDYLKPIPKVERDDLLSAYHRYLTGNDEVKRMAAAKAWSVWEGRTASLLPNKAIVDFFADPHGALSIARIENYYFVNKSFLEPNQLLRDAHLLSGIPGVIVHGRYDLICPLRNAWELHQTWPGSELVVVPDAGHSASEVGISRELVRATNSFADRLK